MNTNCLKDIMCPRCGHTERFAFLVSMWVIVEDEGTDPNVNQAIEWDEKNGILLPVSAEVYCLKMVN